ncbi:MAG: hypothetical protein ACJAZ9_001432 [Neolewinella sp.]|jgi:hypothetical protein
MIRLNTVSKNICPGLFAFQQKDQAVAKNAWEPSDTLLFQTTDLEETVIGLRNPLGLRQRFFETKVPRQLNIGGSGTKDSLKAMGTTAHLDEEMGKKVLRFYLAFANQHQLNTFRLQLKIVAYYQVVSQKRYGFMSVHNSPSVSCFNKEYILLTTDTGGHMSKAKRVQIKFKSKANHPFPSLK